MKTRESGRKFNRTIRGGNLVLGLLLYVHFLFIFCFIFAHVFHLLCDINHFNQKPQESFAAIMPRDRSPVQTMSSSLPITDHSPSSSLSPQNSLPNPSSFSSASPMVLSLCFLTKEITFLILSLIEYSLRWEKAVYGGDCELKSK